MSVLNPATSPAVNAANQIKSIARQMFVQLARSGNQGYNLIWNNPNATPQEVVTALGTDAYVIFQLAGLNIETVAAAANIGGIASPVIPEVPSAYNLTFNLERLATVTSTASSSSSSSSSSS